MIKKKLIITNKLGLHARAAAKLVERASRYSSEIWIKHGDKKANGKSILNVMMLAASKDTEIEIIISGVDEIDALSDLKLLIDQKFFETE